MIKMTRIVLPGMLAQKAGAIVFLSSFGGRIPTPLLSIYSGMYWRQQQQERERERASVSGWITAQLLTRLLARPSATKAFADFFAKSLYGEYASRGVYTQSVTPAMVVSNMSKIRKPSLMVAAPQHIARRSLARVGADVEISPYWMHAIMMYVSRVACIEGPQVRELTSRARAHQQPRSRVAASRYFAWPGIQDQLRHSCASAQEEEHASVTCAPLLACTLEITTKLSNHPHI